MKNSLVFALFVCAAFVGCSDDAPVLLNNSVKSDAGGMPDSSDTTGQTNNVVFPGDDAGQADQGACSPDREDEPDPDFFDANCDGLDGDESQSVFVATYGDDANPGTKGLPKASVAAAVTTAAAEGKSWVLVAESFYDGSVELADGVSIAGGYGFGWKRDGRAKTTFRMGSPVITGVNIQQRTVLMGFEVLGGSAPPGMTAAAVYLQDSPGVVLLDLRITGGKGGDGMRGSVGPNGETGNTGVKGGNAPPDSGGFLGLDCINQSNPPATGAGGEPACGSEDGRGAKGGSAGFNSASGSKGTNGTAGAVGGAGGTPGSPGLEGSNGSSGTTGAPGVGGVAEGAFVDGQWLGQDGSSGESGTAGEGGAGGGGGGGGDKSDGLFNGCGSWGGAGGGGGSGGCGGIGGGGGQSGGASVGVLLLNSDVEIIDCTIIGGLGGRGGDGGDGGEGGMGGAGGAGGNLEENSGKGAKGGIGGRGGRGGQGGGGAGGPSIGLFSSGPLSKAPQASTVMQGEGGTGGAAGGAAGRGADGIAEAVRMP